MLLRTDDRDYLLMAVRHRKDVYDNLDRYVHRINRVTGGIEVIDLTPIDGGASSDGTGPDPHAGEAQIYGSLFDHVSDKELIRLGVAEPLLAAIRALTTDDELLALVDIAPEHTAEVLWQLHAGKSVEEVFDEVTAPARARRRGRPGRLRSRGRPADDGGHNRRQGAGRDARGTVRAMAGVPASDTARVGRRQLFRPRPRGWGAGHGQDDRGAASGGTSGSVCGDRRHYRKADLAHHLQSEPGGRSAARWSPWEATRSSPRWTLSMSTGSPCVS